MNDSAPSAPAGAISFNRRELAERAATLAGGGVFVGSSSWKYPGWCGTIYNASRYEFRGKFALTRFNRNCLEEYAEVFKTVCVDAAYYAFPTRASLESMASQVPEDFVFGFKVTDVITIKNFPNLKRFGEVAGKANANYLNANLFEESFLRPCESIHPHVGLLIFEFSRFRPRDYPQGRDFVRDLDRFLGQLPKGWPYGVEIRNRHWLQAEYFECLSRHKVAHVYNSWGTMPAVSEQMALPGSQTHPHLTAARFMIKPGNKYEHAAQAFDPFDRIHEEIPEVRAAGRSLIEAGLAAGPERWTFVFVNNCLEGNAVFTLASMMP